MNADRRDHGDRDGRGADGPGGPEDVRGIDAVAELGAQLRAAAARRSELVGDLPADLVADLTVVEPGADRPTSDVPVEQQVPPLRPRPVAPPRRRVRRAAAALATAAAIVVGVLVASVIGPGSDPTLVAAGVEVEAGPGLVTVTVDDQADPAAVASALRQAGVTALVEGQRTGPSRVGRFVGMSGRAADLAPGQIADGSVARFDPEGSVTLYVGVPTPDGEFYDAAVDGFAPGEPFAGLGDLVGRPWVEAEPILRERALAEGVDLQVVGGGAGNLGTVQMISSTEARALA